MNDHQTPTVCVLLSTYNGEKYLAEQIDSILNQTGINIKLLIRDDGSSDRSCEITKNYVQRFPETVTLLEGDNVGWKRSYFELIKAAPQVDYYSFSDQDDVWLPEKLSRAVGMLSDKADQCALYAGNVWVTDEQLNISKPYCPRQINMMDRPVATIAAQSGLAGGLTFVFTAKAKDMVLRLYPGGIVGHDSWVFRTCFYFGIVVYDETPMVYYRQHGNNTIGAARGKKWWLEQKVKTLTSDSGPQSSIVAKKLLETFVDVPRNESALIILKLIAAYPKNLWTRAALIKVPDFVRPSAKETALLYIRILIGKY